MSTFCLLDITKVLFVTQNHVNVNQNKMKAKLVKLEDGKYDLLVEYNLEELKNTKLSFKNCQAIERGYDLDELAYSSFPNGTYETSEIDLGLDMYKLGFQKALELMGDKKFSEVNMEDAYYFGSRKLRGEYLDFIKTFQQTEWDVEVEMWFHGTRHKKGEWVPKLDADGCLILKRI